MKGLAGSGNRAVDLHELEAELRRLADRAQVGGSASMSRDV